MKLFKLLLLITICVSTQAQTIQEQQQAELKSKQDVAEKYKKYNKDLAELQSVRGKMVADGAYIVVCKTIADTKGFAFYKGTLWNYFNGATGPQVSINPISKYTKSGDSLSWKETDRPDNLGYEVNFKTHQYFYQRLSTKQIWGPNKCEPVQENYDNL